MLSCSIISEMIKYNGTDRKRINHALKVYALAKAIGESEGIDSSTQYILEISAILHDIGIKVSEQKYNSSSGYYQQIEGPQIAREILTKYKIPEDIIERVCFLIAHHHTYTNIDNIDYQILIEADFLVNIFEDDMNDKQIQNILKNHFKTKAAIEYLKNMYLQENS